MARAPGYMIMNNMIIIGDFFPTLLNPQCGIGAAVGGPFSRNFVQIFKRRATDGCLPFLIIGIDLRSTQIGFDLLQHQGRHFPAMRLDEFSCFQH